MKVRLIGKDGTIINGKTQFSPGRGKKHSVYIIFDEPYKIIYEWPKQKWEDKPYAFSRLQTSAEFYLEGEYMGQIIVWGQGIEYPNNSLCLHPDDCAEIVKGGGG